MSKRRVIKQKYLPSDLPIGTTAIMYLLYKQINPHGTAKGVILTLFIGWLVIVWPIVISQIFLVEPSEPVFKETK